MQRVDGLTSLLNILANTVRDPAQQSDKINVIVDVPIATKFSSVLSIYKLILGNTTIIT